MNDLDKKAWGGLIFFMAAMAVLIFLPAWTFRYWQAWTYMVVFFVSVGAITFYLMRKDRALLLRRMGVGSAAEKERSQKVIQFIAQFAFIAIYILSALDYRFEWSVVPFDVLILGDILTALGLFIVFLVFKENTYTSATVEIAKDQKVISSGPYGIVRHPMYSGALFLFIGTPLALGSFWGLLTVVPMTFVLIWRLIEEEKFLLKNLAGYPGYTTRVRSRLIPGVF